MTPQEIQSLKEALVITADICGRQLSDAAIRAYAEDLACHDYPKVIGALKILRKKGRFPSIGEVENIISPELSQKDEALEISGNIVKAMSKFGWSNPQEAEAFIGELGWETVKRFGGWRHLCGTINSENQSYLVNQLNQILESMIRRRSYHGAVDFKPSYPLLERDEKTSI